MTYTPNKVLITNEKRPCYIDGKRALFHGWSDRAEAVDASPFIGGHPAGFVKWTVGIVEYEDGTVQEIAPTNIRFADGGEFSEIAWNDIKNEQK